MERRIKIRDIQRAQENVRRRVSEAYIDECIKSTAKHDGDGINVWGCFAGISVGIWSEWRGSWTRISIMEYLYTMQYRLGSNLLEIGLFSSIHQSFVRST